MNDQPSVDAHGEQETKPSLLATLSLMLGLIPWVLVSQLVLVTRYRLGPAWLRNFLSIDPGTLILAIPVATVSSIVCGSMALSAIKRDNLLSGKCKAVMGRFLAGAFCVVFVGAASFPTVCGGKGKARAAHCISNLKAISTAITLYADDHEGQMPATLEEMVNGTYFPLKWTGLTCPVSKQKYHYPGAGGMWQSDQTAMAAYCGTNHVGRMNVLFIDGAVKGLTQAEFDGFKKGMEKNSQGGEQRTH
jgi:prepilin-type processing-associated H-X9-DG protein